MSSELNFHIKHYNNGFYDRGYGEIRIGIYDSEGRCLRVLHDSFSSIGEIVKRFCPTNSKKRIFFCELVCKKYNLAIGLNPFNGYSINIVGKTKEGKLEGYFV